jgi:hypothetical protein
LPYFELGLFFLAGISRRSVTLSVLLVSCPVFRRSLETCTKTLVFVYLSKSGVRHV